MPETVTITREEYERLSTSAALFEQIADSAPVLIWVSGVDALCTWFNKPWIAFRGRTMEEETGNGWAEGVHKEDFDRCVEIYLSNFEKRTPFQMEYRLLRADGEYRWLLDHGVPRYSDTGLFLGFIGSCIDITDVTEIKQAWDTQQNISKRLGELAAIVESSDEVIISKNLDSIVTSWNAAASRLFGYTAQEMIGQSILKLIPEELHSEEKTFIETLRSGQRIEQFETRRITKSGQILDVSLTLSPVRDAQGKVVGASKILRDISIAKRLAQSFLQAEKLAATGRMAATIAHEINNPLEAVTNLLYLARHGQSVESVQSFVEAAERELRRVAIITNQTLRFHKQSTNPERVHPAELIEMVLSVHERRLKSGNITAELRHDPSKPILCFAGDVRQVLNNLISNSIDAMDGSGGRLLVRTHVSRNWETQQQGFVFTVADTGSGIPADKLSHIFDPFFTTKGSSGNGLGLWISKEIASRQRGSLQARSSTREGASWTVFRFFLPAETFDGLR